MLLAKENSPELNLVPFKHLRIILSTNLSAKQVVRHAIGVLSH